MTLDGGTCSLDTMQALSAFSVIPPIIATLKVVIARRGEIKEFFASLPWKAWEEMAFIIVGKPDTGRLDQSCDSWRMCEWLG